MVRKLRKLLLILLIPVFFTGSTQPISLRGIATTSYGYLKGIVGGIGTGSVKSFNYLGSVARRSFGCLKPIASFSRRHIRGISGGLVGIASLGIGYLLCKNLLADPLDQNITIGNYRCRGKSFTETGNEDVSIDQVHVLDQFTSGGGGCASCGYHALKNAREIVTAVQQNDNRNLQNRVNDPDIVERLFGPEGIWRNYTIRRGNQRIGENLEGDEIQGIINRFNILPEHLTVIESIEDIVDQHGNNHVIYVEREMPHVKVPQIMREFQNAETYTHGFIVGTMRQPQGEGEDLRRGTNGHWIAFIVHKQDNKMNYIVADSTNNPYVLYNNQVRGMIAQFESPAVAGNLHAPESELQGYERSLGDAVDDLNTARVRILELYEQYKALGGSRSFTPELDETAL